MTDRVPAQGAACGICGSERLRSLFEARDRNFNTTDRTFTVARCPECGIAQTIPHPAPSEFALYYPAVYYPTTELDAASYHRFIGRYQEDKVSRLLRFRKSGSLLDVGCGVGYFLKEVGKKEFQARGVEVSELAARTGRERFNLDIVCGDIFSCAFASGSFDIVTLWQVLEHVPEPVKVLAEVGRILKKGGLLIIAVPNISSFQAGAFRSRWYHLDVPRHLYHFDPPGLKRLVGDAGFETQRIMFFSREHNWAGYIGSIVRLAPPHQSLLERAARKLVGHPLSHLLAWSESLARKGGTFELYATKL